MRIVLVHLDMETPEMPDLWLRMKGKAWGLGVKWKEKITVGDFIFVISFLIFFF